MLVGRGRRPTIIIIILCATLLTFIQQIEAIHRQLSKSELIHTFGVHKVEHVPEYEVIEARRYHDESGRVIRIHFLAWNETYEIELKPNHRLISPYIKTKVYDVNSSTTFDGLLSNSTANCHFHGRVVSHGHLRAAVSDCSKLSGVIVADDHFLMLQTLPEKTAEFEQRRHVVYKRSAALINPLENYDIFEKAQKRRKRASNVNLRFAPSDTSNVNFNVDFGDESKARKDAKSAEELEEFCDINNNLLHLNYTIPPEAKLDSLYIFSQLDPITLEIGLFLDSQLYEHFQREFTVEPERHLTDFSLALINNVHVLYQQPTLTPNLEIVIVHFEMWKKQPPQLVTEVHRNGQAQTLLDSFCRHQARINPGTDLTDPNHWDHGVLLTGYDIYHTTSSVAGVAPVGRMCDELFACSLVEGLHLGRSFVLAHEMGHNMGMVHDGVQNQCGRSCCLMSAVNGAGKTTWSTCSVREFNAFLLQLDDSGRGNCLRDPAESIATHNHLKDGRLPGQRFTADQQCSYFWGRNYRVEIPNGRSYEDICRILWCGNSGSTISTAHPALEGSWCGGERWCHEGRCEVWNRLASPVPKVVDGQWSDWSSAEKKCPITPCQVTGSIVLTNQLRTCTNPAPNNGGRPCSGLNVRGLVCGSAKSTCESFGRQEFGDRLCSAIRNDIHWPDVQLSGLSFLHATQPCKVWCHVRDSELIRNKGQFPNGSPCGDDGHYCVGGTCLRLSCRNRAVVDSDADCPPEEATGVGDKKTAKWEPWSDWLECSIKCGTHGVQKRTRKCRSVESECNGKSSEVRACDPMPPKCVKYSEWGDWSKCSAVCGGKSTGKRRRERACEAGPCQLKELEREEDCRNEDLCPAPEWQPWGEWSTCSVTCGHGQRKRRRVCRQRADSDSDVESDAECEGEASIIESCVLQECPADEKTKNATERSKTDTKNAGYNGSSGDSADQVVTWSEWLPCSVSCGIGFQLREGLCGGKPCRQRRKQARTCNMQDCSKVLSGGVMSEWSLWSACSRTCGQGFQYRHRKCLNAICAAEVARSEHRRCVLGPCPTWTEWEQWSFDCASCSLFKARKRRRKCKVTMADEETLVADESCSGAAFEVENCENACASRNQFQQQPSLREHTEGTRRLFGAPIVTAERQTPEVSPPDKESYWGEWTSWSSCSRVCGNGRQTRTRACRIALTFLCDGTARENRPCNTFACIDQDLIQAAPAIPTWSEWSEFSKCSCFTLTMFRRRYCQVIDPTVQGFCAGSVIQQRPCKPVSCAAENGGWSEWSDWSRCSRECGASAHQIRNRMCASPLPSNRGAYCVGYSFDQRPCDHPVPTECEQLPGDGGWSNWTEWSECSDPCLNGQRSRTRYCTNPRPANDGRQCDGLDFELQPCSNAEACAAFAGEQSSVVQTNGTMVTVVPRDGGLSVWSPWSSCTTTCGLAAFQSRQRVCDSPPPAAGGRPCSGLVYMTSVCRTESACPNAIDGQWGSWSAWSESNCESTCIEFNGMRTRTRECVSPAPANGGLPCFGRFVERAPCINTTQNAYAPLAICRITERIRSIDGEASAVLNAI